MNKAVDQSGDIFPTFTQGRNGEGKDVQAVIKVTTKRAVLHGLQQIAMGSRNNSHIHFDRMRRANPQHFAFLQYAQQAGLCIQRHFTDFVEQQRTAVRQFEFACRTAATRSGKGAIDVAKQLALHQIARQGAAVDRDKGFVAALTAVVDCLSEQLLAGAAFPVSKTVLSLRLQVRACMIASRMRLE